MRHEAWMEHDERVRPPRPDPISGWAVVDGGKINVRTVSDTKRAAMVNWLVVEKNLLVLASSSAEQIERMWWGVHGDADGALRALPEVSTVPVSQGSSPGTLHGCWETRNPWRPRRPQCRRTPR